MKDFESLKVPGPTKTPVTKPFWEAVGNQSLKIQKCTNCNKWIFYPRSHCPHCWSKKIVWKRVSGKGRLKTWCEVHKPGNPSWEEVAPYILGLVELEEGPTMMSHLLIEFTRDLYIDLPLEVTYIKCNEVWLPFFKEGSDNSE